MSRIFRAPYLARLARAHSHNSHTHIYETVAKWFNFLSVQYSHPKHTPTTLVPQIAPYSNYIPDRSRRSAVHSEPSESDVD